MQEIIEKTLLSEFEICRALFDLASRNLIASMARESAAEKTGGKVARRGGLDIGELAAKVLYPIVGLVALGGLVLGSKNSLNNFSWPLRPVPAIEALRRDDALGRLKRLAAAVDAFSLAIGRAPQSTQELVET